MRKLMTILFIAMIAAAFASAPAFADPGKGQKIFIKILKKPCGMTGGEMAVKHTQEEWQQIYDAGQLNEELLNVCPDAEPVKDSYLPHVFDFLFNYASDSGNVPAC
jgi:hypothetical protein